MTSSAPVTSNAIRQRRRRARLRAEGVTEITVTVPQVEAGSVTALAARLLDDRDLTVGPLRRISTGRLERV
jgi:hypothetical protein